LLTQMEATRNLMTTLLIKQDRDLLKQLFGGHCQRIVRIESVLNSTALSPMYENDQRLPLAKKAVHSILQVLQDLGLNSQLETAERDMASVNESRQGSSAAQMAVETMEEMGLGEVLATLSQKEVKTEVTSPQKESAPRKRISPAMVRKVLKMKNRPKSVGTASIEKSVDSETLESAAKGGSLVTESEDVGEQNEERERSDPTLSKLLQVAIVEGAAVDLDRAKIYAGALEKYREVEAKLHGAEGVLYRDAVLLHLEKVRNRIAMLEALEPGKKAPEAVEVTISRTVFSGLKALATFSSVALAAEEGDSDAVETLALIASGAAKMNIAEAGDFTLGATKPAGSITGVDSSKEMGSGASREFLSPVASASEPIGSDDSSVAAVEPQSRGVVGSEGADNRKAIEDGRLRDIGERIFHRHDKDGKGNLDWNSGAIRSFTLDVFDKLRLPPPQEGQIYGMYARFDADGDWSLNMRESCNLVEVLCCSLLGVEGEVHRAKLVVRSGKVREMAAASFKERDVDESGYLDWQSGEIRNFIGDTFEALGLRCPDDEDLRSTFELFDKNKNGVMSSEECVNFMEHFCKALYQIELADEASSCPLGHTMAIFSTPRPGYTCNNCNISFQENVGMWACHSCDFHLCIVCSKERRVKAEEEAKR